MLLQHMFALALQQVSADCLGNMVGFLVDRASDKGQVLRECLQRAAERTWRGLELLLQNDAWWKRVEALLRNPDERSAVTWVRNWLVLPPDAAERELTRSQALRDLRSAGQRRLLTGGAFSTLDIGNQLRPLKDGSEDELREAREQTLGRICSLLGDSGYPHLAGLLTRGPAKGAPFLVVALRHFLQQGIEEHRKQFRGVTFACLDQLEQAQAKAFGRFHDALERNAAMLEQLLDAEEVHSDDADEVIVAEEVEEVLDSPSRTVSCQCPHCRRGLEVGKEHTGRSLRCQGCSGIFHFTGTAALPCPPPQPRPAVPPPVRAQCPHCRRPIVLAASVRDQTLSCPHCRGAFRLG